MKNFFIIGAPKTGTTLLARLIDSHPEIACTTELFPFHMKGGRRVINKNWRGKLEDHEVPKYLWEPLTRIRNTDFLMSPDNNKYIHMYFDNILKDFASRCNASIVGDKFPWYIGFIDDMLEMFPDAHYIYNVRDPRAVWNSAKNFTRRGRADSLLKQMLHYDKKIEPYMDRDNFHCLKFEDFVTMPKSELFRLHIPLGADPRAVDNSVTQYPARFKGIPNSTKPLDPAICTKWKTQMTAKEIKRVTNMSADFIKKYGYGE